MKGVINLLTTFSLAVFCMATGFAQTNDCEAFFNITSVSGLTVHFNNESVYTNNPSGDLPPTVWDFGDGTSSNDYDVAHTFQADGTYTVCVSAMSLNGGVCDIYCTDITLGNSNPCQYEVVLTTNGNVIVMALEPLDPNTPMPNQINWILEGGGGVVGSGSPFTYQNAGSGTYTFCADYELSGTTCSGVVCENITIPDDPTGPNCDLIVEHLLDGLTVTLEAHNAGSVDFTNVVWTIGVNGGVQTGVGSPFSFTFPSPGIYQVCADGSINNQNGEILCEDHHCFQLHVPGENPNCNTNFEFVQVNSGGYIFSIIDHPNPDLDYANISWIVYDDQNNIVTTDSGPAFDIMFANPGVYYVCVTADLHGPDGAFLCEVHKCHYVTVPGNNNCNFSVTLTHDGPVITMILASDDPSLPPPNQVHWILEGTGLVGTGNPFTYTVNAPGNYTFCASFSFDGSNCQGVVCEDILIPGSQDCDNLGIGLDWNNDLTYHLFIDGTSGGGGQFNAVHWTISNNNGYTAQVNGAPASFTFPAAGLYQVCLNAMLIGPNGNIICQIDECIIVDIHDPSTDCQYDVHLAHNGFNVTMAFLSPGSDPLPDQITWILEGGGGVIGNGPTLTYTVPGPGFYEFCAVYGTPNTVCSGVECATIFIPGNSPDCHLGIEYDLNGLNGVFEAFNTGANVQFTNISWEISGFGAIWTGSGSPFSFDFPNPGTYQVCATGELINPTTGEVVCVDDLCIPVHIAPPDICQIGFEWDQTGSGQYVFVAHGNPNLGFGLSNVGWTITGPNGNVFSGSGNPFTIQFPAPGAYHVCVNADVINPNGVLVCELETCHVVHVPPAPTPCSNVVIEHSISGLTGTFSLPQPTPTNAVWTNAAWHISNDNFSVTSSDLTVTVNFPGPGFYVACVDALLTSQDGNLICEFHQCITFHVENPNGLCEAFFEGHEWLNSPNPAANQAIFFNLSSGNYSNVLWNFGDGTVSDSQNDEVFHIFPNPGVYNVCLTVANPNLPDCEDTYCDLIFISGVNPCNFEINADVDGQVLTASLANANGNTPNVVEWYLGGSNTFIGDANPIVYTFSAAGIYELCVDFEISGTTCAGTQCTLVTINNDDCEQTDCVFPGDANHDQIANNFDILPIGIGFGTTGPVRPNASNEWYGQPGPDWQELFAGGLNYKHADCNGNGSIGFSDIEPIILNYDRTHNGVTPTNFSEVPPIWLEFDFDTLYVDANTANLVINASVNVANMSLPAEDLYGIAFTVNYPAELVQEGSAEAMYTGDSWFGESSGVLQLEVFLNEDNRIDFGYSRTDQLNVNGFGEIATTSYVITDNLIGFAPMEEYEFTLTITDIRAISRNGQIKSFEPQSATAIIIVDDSTTGINDPLSNAIKVYPNPTNDILNMEWPEANGERVEVYNSLGQIIYHTDFNNSSMSLNVSNWSSGIYLISIRTDRGLISKRIMVE